MKAIARFAEGSPAQFGVVLGGIIMLCLLGAGLSALGLPGNLVAYLFVFVGLALGAALNKLNLPTTPAGAGLTVSIEWLSAFGLFGIVGAVFALGHDGLAVLIGLMGGFVISLLLIAPRLSALSIGSLPDFLEARYGSHAIRMIALGIMSIVTVLFVAAQLAAAGLIATQVFQVPAAVGIVVGVAGILIHSIPARRGTLSAGHVILSVVALAGLGLATVWLLSAKTGILIPHLAYGGLFSDIAAAEARLELPALFGSPFEGFGVLNFLLLTASLAIGSAVMPHLVGRVSSGGQAGRTQFTLKRGLILFAAVATTLPALAVLAQTEVLSLFVAAQNNLQTDSIPSALLYQDQGLAGGLSADQLTVQPSSVLLAVPALSGASDWMVGLFALIGFAVVAVAGAGAVYGLADAISSKTPSSNAPRERSISIVIVTVVAALVAIVTGLDVISLGAWAYSLIGAALFAPMVLGLWWRRATTGGAIAGMLGGFAVTAAYIICASVGFDFAVGSGDEWRLLNAGPMTAGAFGVIASLFLTALVSMLSDEPSLAQMDVMDSLDGPEIKVSPEVLE